MSSAQPSETTATNEVPTSGTPQLGVTTDRVVSVDTLRGLTILLMVFVNDLGPAAPSWMHHIQPPDADGMTLADIVFPAFLFIVGISIPLAIERALQSGKTQRQVLLHIFVRTLGLLAMGLIEINRSYDVTLGGQLWGMLAFVAILLAWCIVPRQEGTRRQILLGLKSAGVIGLMILLVVFRREPVATEVLFLGPVENWIWLRTEWWGILGLIGWAYLTASVLYLLLRTRREWLMAAMALLLVNYLALSQGGFFTHVDSKGWLAPLRPLINMMERVLNFAGSYVDLRSGPGSLAAITVAGSLLGTTLIGPNKLVDAKSRLRWAAMFAFGLFLAGLAFDNFAGINKISATPTWSLWCAAITCATWAVVYRLMDVGGWTKWSIVVQPAGANPLIAYLLHPVLIAAVSLIGLGGPLLAYKNSSSAAVVMLGSLVMALLICGLTGAIARLGLRVRI